MAMGLLFDIKRYAIHDGPGIRITLFFKGCPLSCVWCHNPEGISPRPEKMYTARKCIGCGICIKGCPSGALAFTPQGIRTNPHACTLCGTCADRCPSLATELSGTGWSVEEAMHEIRKETIVMDYSGGGVTLCGGEPLMQKQFLLDILQACGREGIHRTVDTSLYAPAATVREVIPHTDLFLVDLKHMDPEQHRRYCSVPNEPILHNLQLVAGSGTPFYIRIPLIKGFNATHENIEATAAFLASLPWKEKKVELLPYHDIGKNKHEKLGTCYNPEAISLQPPDEEETARLIKLLKKNIKWMQ